MDRKRRPLDEVDWMDGFLKVNSIGVLNRIKSIIIKDNLN